MQWCSSVFGSGADEYGHEQSNHCPTADAQRRLRCAWIRSLVQRGDYDGPDALEGLIDAWLGTSA